MSKTDKPKPYLNLGKATHCSVSFLVSAIASNSVANAQSQAMTNSGYDLLGFVNVALLYLSMGIGCLFATAIQDRIGTKMCFVIGSFSDFFFIVSCIPSALTS